MTKGADYYFLKSEQLGWGERSAKLDNERVKLLRKFVVGKKILDIGCGTGIYVDFLSRQGCDATGVDFVENFINDAIKTKNGTFLVGSAEKLPFKSSEFDSSILFDILEHGDDIKILNEAKRVTKKRLMVIVPQVVDEQLAKSGVVFRHYIDKSHLREYNKVSLRKLAKKIGLKTVHIQDVNPLYNETIFMALFGGNLFLKKILRKIVLMFLRKKYYPTEVLAVLDK